ncbi:2-dehydropantoate 2-reductase [Haloechinothrix salitolerans]|uniref:2-dehydropantoate 2-reductase n=1 Tax=Haloechinothrix salitolerans TaxID=926830 RepID=A0ABW2C2B1_9PSEU
MRVVVLGAGGLGSVVGGFLAEAGTEVTLIGRQAHVDAINQHGLRITGRRGEVLVDENLVALTDPGQATGPFDYLILAVKGKDTHAALTAAEPLGDKVVTAFSLQNGLGKDDALRQWLGEGRVIGASTIEGGTLVEPGTVHNHLTADVTAYFGELDGRITPRVEAITTAFDKAGLAASAAGCIDQITWEKLAQISLAAAWSVTTLGAVRGVSVFAGMAVREGAEYFVALAKDLLAVYRAQGYTPQNFYAPLSRLKELDELSVEEAVTFITQQAAQQAEQEVAGHPSMYEDVVRGRKTEIDFMITPYLTAADAAGLEVPTLRTAYRIIKTLDTFLG